MSQIEDYQQRISSALARIGTGVERLGSSGGGGTSEEVEKLRAALEDEQQVNAQLEERVKALKDRQDHAIAEMKADAAVGESRISQLDMDLQRLRRANEQLTQTVEILRGAIEDGVAEPHLINKAMLAELEALRASRATDVAEADAIFSAIKPLLQDDAAAQEETA